MTLPHENTPFDFHGTAMTIRATTPDTGLYALIEMRHPPLVGPALHVHRQGTETFLVVQGSYSFYRGDEAIMAVPGDIVVIPKGVPHRYLSGEKGGQVMVITPPNLEHYFWEIGGQLRAGGVTREQEFAIAAQYGQEFLDRAGHWGEH